MWHLCSITVFLRNVLDMMAIRRVSDTQDLPFRKCVGWATGHSCSSSKWQLPEQCCDRYHSAITSQHSGPSLLLWTICDTVLRFLVAVVLMTRLSFAREGERAFRLQRNSTDQLSPQTWRMNASWNRVLWKQRLDQNKKYFHNIRLCWFWRRVKVGWAINVFSRRSLESNLKGKAHIRPKLWRVPKVLACSEKWSILAFGVRAQEFRMQHVPAMSPNRFLTRATVWKIIVCCFWLTLAKSAAWLFAHMKHCCYEWCPISMCGETSW